MSRKAERLSFNMCAETCPNLEDAVYSAYDEISKALSLNERDKETVFELLIEKHVEKFKEAASYKLRDALNEACEKIIELESEMN